MWRRPALGLAVWLALVLTLGATSASAQPPDPDVDATVIGFRPLGTIGGAGTEEGAVTDVGVAGDVLFVLARRLPAYDVSEPSRPARLGAVSVPRLSGRLFIDDSRVCIESQSAGASIVDVSDPGDMTVAGSFIPESPVPLLDSAARGVACDGDTLYVTTQGTLWVVDFTDPSRPQAVGLGSLGPFALYRMDIHPVGDLVYVGTGYTFEIHDASDPSRMRRLGSTTDPALGADIVGSTAYVAGGNVRLLDVSDPNTPTETARSGSGGSAQDVDEASGRLFVADGHSGLTVRSGSAASGLRLLGGHPTAHDAERVVFSGRFVFVATGQGGAEIFETVPLRRRVHMPIALRGR